MKLKIIALSMLVSFAGVADEGMWQPHQLPELEAVLKSKGLAIEASSIANLTAFPMNAVISLGGCTASFVSASGLAVTNHHCAFSSIAHNSTPENNILKNGFLAKTLEQELPAAPGSKMWLTENVSNVTRQIQQELTPQLRGKARFDEIEQIRKQIVAECEATPGYRCEVYSFHGGLEYYLMKQMEIRDVRLVHAPALSVGNFGGDIDNWMWPRHTGDYSFFRAYVGKDGKPADFSAENVPFVPPSFLKVSAKGVQENDFVMVLGYPGRTSRYDLAEDVRNKFNQRLPQEKAYREQTIALIEKHAPAGSDSRMKYESNLAGLANYAKNFDGMIAGYQQGNLQQRKDEFYAELQRWIKADPARKVKYQPVFKEMELIIKTDIAQQDREMVLNYFANVQLFRTARRLYRLSVEQQKPDEERERGFQVRDEDRQKSALKRMSRSYDPAVDLELALHFLQKYHALPAQQHIATFDQYFGLGETFDEAAVRAKLESIYKASTLSDEIERLAWLGKTPDDFKNSQDPAIQFAVTMFADDMKLEDEEKEQLGYLSQVLPKVMDAIIQYNKSLSKPVYADANSTLRVTYGTVQGYQPRDGVYNTPFTTIGGLKAKITKEEPFDAPLVQQEAIAKADFAGYLHPQLNTLPVNFLSNVDTTGGNSGSPTLNGQAELVGLLFDGVVEGLLGDVDYDVKLNRSIHLDSRYMLWQMEEVDGATNLVKEMTVIR